MTTNRDWLFSLPLEDKYAWMNAEHAESSTSATMQHIGQVIEDTVKRGVYGDTAAQDADSREQLEEDVLHHVEDIRNKSGWTGVCANYGTVIEWLDRQAAITERECRKPNWNYCETCETLAELTAERDKLQEQLYIGWECECRLQAERERYRSKFGKCLDYADAIHALMDDEGMA